MNNVIYRARAYPYGTCPHRHGQACTPIAAADDDTLWVRWNPWPDGSGSGLSAIPAAHLRVEQTGLPRYHDGTLCRYTDLGSYPLFYIVADSGTLCHGCAAQAETDGLTVDPSDPQWNIVAAEVNWEDTSLFCDHCGDRIKSAYAEDDVCVNLDSMTLSEVYGWTLDHPTAHRGLRRYAVLRLRAENARLAGRIMDALRTEARMDRLYASLPETLQW